MNQPDVAHRCGRRKRGCKSGRIQIMAGRQQYDRLRFKRPDTGKELIPMWTVDNTANTMFKFDAASAWHEIVQWATQVVP